VVESLCHLLRHLVVLHRKEDCICNYDEDYSDVKAPRLDHHLYFVGVRSQDCPHVWATTFLVFLILLFAIFAVRLLSFIIRTSIWVLVAIKQR